MSLVAGVLHCRAMRHKSHTQRYFLFRVLLALALLAHAPISPADTQGELIGAILSLRISGEISSEDLQSVTKHIRDAEQVLTKQNRPLEIVLALDSRGGDVIAAMAIGRLMREKASFGFVMNPGGTKPEECSSACILILAGTTTRAVGGRVGIHRTFFPTLDASTSYDEVREQMRKIEQQILDYLRDMDIPTSLLEEMKSTPPGSIRYLTKSELSRFRLDGIDPATEEKLDAKAAQELGISREEFYLRRARVTPLCGPFSDTYLKCYHDVMSGKR